MGSILKSIYNNYYVDPWTIQEQRKLDAWKKLEPECQKRVDTIESKFTDSFSRGHKTITIDRNTGVTKEMFECIEQKTNDKYGTMIRVEYKPLIVSLDDDVDSAPPYVKMTYKE